MQFQKVEAYIGTYVHVISLAKNHIRMFLKYLHHYLFNTNSNHSSHDCTNSHARNEQPTWNLQYQVYKKHYITMYCISKNNSHQ